MVYYLENREPLTSDESRRRNTIPCVSEGEIAYYLENREPLTSDESKRRNTIPCVSREK